MNEEIFKHLQDQCWIYNTHPDMIDTDSNSDARPCGFDTKKFAELIYKDIITVVAAQALLNESALDVFKNLKRIYEGVEE